MKRNYSDWRIQIVIATHEFCFLTSHFFALHPIQQQTSRIRTMKYSAIALVALFGAAAANKPQLSVSQLAAS
jgi:hypothetical protein